MLTGGAVRVTATLRSPSDDASLWGQSYEAGVADAFKIQAQIVRELAAGIRLRLTPAEHNHLGSIYVARQDAQDLYLRGRFLLYQFNRERMKDACDAFAEAVGIDPHYGIAWASLARCHVLRENYGDLSAAEARSLVTEAASRALAEDRHWPKRISRRQRPVQIRLELDRCTRQLRSRLESNPTTLWAVTYARFLSAAERHDEAIEQARRAEEIDPLSAEVKGTVAMMFYATAVCRRC